VNGDKAVFTDVVLSAPELADPGTPASPSDAELADIFAFMDTDGDGVADDGSGTTIDTLRDEMQVPASEPSAPPVVKAAKLEFEGLGVFDGVANFALMKLSDVTITPAEGSEDQSTGKISSIELMNPSPETAAWVASLLGKGEPAPFPEGKALSFDRWLVNGVAINVADASGTGSFTIDSVHISDLKEEKAGLMGLSNLKFDFLEAAGSDVKVSLEGFGVKGINYGLFSEAVAAGAGAASDPTALTSAIQADPANPGLIIGAGNISAGAASSVTLTADGDIASSSDPAVTPGTISGKLVSLTAGGDVESTLIGGRSHRADTRVRRGNH
jgi:hypothetical protein